MRSVQTEASTHDQSRASAPCLAICTGGAFLASSIPSAPYLPALPWLGMVLLAILLTSHSARSPRFRLRRIATMRAVTPLRLTLPQRSLRLLRPAFRASRSQPLDGHAHRFDRHLSLSVSQGFALQSQARRTIPPSDVILRATHSLPVALHPVSARGRCKPHPPRALNDAVTFRFTRYGSAWRGLTPADKTSSRTHDCFASLAMTERFSPPFRTRPNEVPATPFPVIASEAKQSSGRAGLPDRIASSLRSSP